MADTDLDRWLTVAECTHWSGIGRTTLYGLMDSGRLSYAKVGRSRRIYGREIERLMQESTVGGRDAQ